MKCSNCRKEVMAGALLCEGGCEPSPASAGYAPYVGVWLQWAEESDGTEDVTWCQDKVNDDDTLYLRADCVVEALAGNIAAIEALKFIIQKEDRLRELVGA